MRKGHLFQLDPGSSRPTRYFRITDKPVDYQEGFEFFKNAFQGLQAVVQFIDWTERNMGNPPDSIPAHDPIFHNTAARDDYRR